MWLVECLALVAVISVANFGAGYALAAHQRRRAAPTPAGCQHPAHEVHSEMIRPDFQPVLDGVAALVSRLTKAEAERDAQTARAEAAETNHGAASAEADAQRARADAAEAQLAAERQDRADEKAAALAALGVAPAGADTAAPPVAANDSVSGGAGAAVIDGNPGAVVVG